MVTFQDKLTQWVVRQKAQRAQSVPLSVAWFGEGLVDYTFYRLNYFSLNTLLTMCLHVVEFYFLTRVFDGGLLKGVLSVRILSFVLFALWWGILETMRDRVKTLRGELDGPLVSRELGCWYLLGSTLAAGLWCGALIYMYKAIEAQSTQALGDGYCAIILFTLGLRLCVETKKAGVFAVSRIWRPMWSVMISPLLGLGCIVLFWWMLGAYALLGALLLERLITTLLSFYYVTRTQKQLQYPAILWPSLYEWLTFLKGLFNQKTLAAALAFLVIDSSGILVLLLSFTGTIYSLVESGFILFYFIHPLFKAASSWAMLFYFDFKRYQVALISPFLSSFVKKMMGFTIVLGAIFAAVAMLVTAGYFHEKIYFMSILFLVLFILRTMSAFVQVIAFCQGRYGLVIFSGVVTILAIFSTSFVTDLFYVACILLCGMGMGILIILAPGFFSFSLGKKVGQLTLYAWLVCLKRVKEPVQLWRFEISPQMNGYQKRVFIQLVFPKALYQKSAWFWVDNHTIVGCTQGDCTPFVTKILIRAAGCVVAYQFLKPSQDSIDALDKAKHFLMPHLMDTVMLTLGDTQLIALFQARFPEGWCHQGKHVHTLMGYTYKKNRAIYYQSLLYKIVRTLTCPCDDSEDHESSISVIFPLNKVPIIFVIPYSYENRAAAKEWKQHMYAWNIHQIG